MPKIIKYQKGVILMSSLYETIWLNEKNRTLIISSIITIGTIIIAILFASVDYQGAPNWLKGLYREDPQAGYNVGLTLLELFLMCVFYFFLLIAIGTFVEIRAGLPSWGTILTTVLISLLFTWLVTSIRPGEAKVKNFTPAMQGTIFGGLILFMILSVVYLALTTTEEKK